MKNNYRGYVGTYIQQLSMQVYLLMLTSHFQGFLSLPNFIVRSHFKQINYNLLPGTCIIFAHAMSCCPCSSMTKRNVHQDGGATRSAASHNTSGKKLFWSVWDNRKVSVKLPWKPVGNSTSASGINFTPKISQQFEKEMLTF